MTQEIDVKKDVAKVLDDLEQMATPENIELMMAFFKILLGAWLKASEADKFLIRILVIILSGILIFLAGVRIVT